MVHITDIHGVREENSVIRAGQTYIMADITTLQNGKTNRNEVYFHTREEWEKSRARGYIERRE